MIEDLIAIQASLLPRDAKDDVIHIKMECREEIPTMVPSDPRKKKETMIEIQYLESNFLSGGFSLITFSFSSRRERLTSITWDGLDKPDNNSTILPRV